MTDDMLGPSPLHIKYSSYYRTDFAYDGPIFLVPLSLSYNNIIIIGIYIAPFPFIKCPKAMHIVIV